MHWAMRSTPLADRPYPDEYGPGGSLGVRMQMRFIGGNDGQRFYLECVPARG
jgi:hypothetical protein